MRLNLVLVVGGVAAVAAAAASVSVWLAVGLLGAAAIGVGLIRDDGSSR